MARFRSGADQDAEVLSNGKGGKDEAGGNKGLTIDLHADSRVSSVLHHFGVEEIRQRDTRGGQADGRGRVGVGVGEGDGRRRRCADAL